MIAGIHPALALQVYVVSHGWHTGLVVPADTVSDRLPQLKTRFPDASYIEFGWGDHDFYTAKEITVSLALHSILIPTDSVMHAVALPTTPDEYFIGSEVNSLCLDTEDYMSLIDHIVSGFSRDSDGLVDELDAGIYGDSQFYTGHGNYHLFNTCNKWTAQGLAAAGLEIWPSFILRAESVMTSIDDAHARGYPSDCPEYPDQ
jgi:uncharacterized protein (TIGR02117 family)